MIRYSYNRQLDPPAPFVLVALRCDETGNQLVSIPAQLDTGADRTVLPQAHVDKLGLLPMDELRICGFGGQVLLLPTYRVQLGMHDFPVVTIEVIAHSEESHVLLGRDVMNRHRLLLDGPQFLLEIG